MKYIGLQQQIDSNNRKSILLLLSFPILVLVLVFAFISIINFNPPAEYNNYTSTPYDWDNVISQFIEAVPYVFVAVGVWFVIAYWSNTAMINASAHSETLSRKENMRVYNLTENLCMSVGMTMPKLRIIESGALNAFASGINEKNYTVTLTRGIIDKLNDDELEGVIAHELTHIRNRDVRLLIVSIIFVGIFSFLINIAFRLLWSTGGSRRRGKDDKGGGAIFLVVLVLAILGYFFSIFFKLSLSRKREYLADSGAVEMTKKPLALASALEKISGRDEVPEVSNKDVKQMFISNGSFQSKFLGGLRSLFSTHPPIEKRIELLKQF
ncbi:MAG: M48 family metallopeptidase [Brumimicrobium sp.]|nr:M48 family metallopeptidase [Brumimicrobium sp.]MCO5268528.1 M48 family metallopeptidase [Brumimicrobium sp.]